MIKLKVEKILYNKNNNVIFKPTILKSSALSTYWFNVSVKDVIVNVGDVFEINDNEEDIVDNGVYGSLLKIKDNKNIKKTESFGVDYIRFMLKERIKGIGTATIEKMLNAFGTDLVTTLEKEPEKIVGLTKTLTKKKVDMIREQYLRDKSFDRMMLFATMYDIKISDFETLYKEFGLNAVKYLQENPYKLYKILNFSKIDNIGKQLGINYDNKDRVRAIIMFFMEDYTINKGNMFCYYDELLNSLNTFIKKFSSFEEEVKIASYETELNELFNEKVLVKEEDRVYIYYYNFIENKIVEKLSNLINDFKPPLCPVKLIKEHLKDTILSNTQKEAVITALTSGISVITGGAGVGKTLIIKEIVNIIKADGKRVCLIAPTGKASQRMKELTGEEAYTIHRRLGLNPYENNDKELVEINEDLVIIDESSMIDANVFYKLISNINENTRILFVGDYNQLPPVGVGLLFRELINSGKINTIRLTETFRQGKDSSIYINSKKIIEGKNDFKYDKDFEIIKTNSLVDIEKQTLKTINRLIEEGYDLDDIQVLTPVRESSIGSKNINCKIQDEKNKRVFGKKQTETTDENGERQILRTGDRVIQIKNNYDLKVFNGDIGKITKISDELITVQYNHLEEEVSYDSSNWNEIELAYALTIHKSQGSEFKVVIILLHSVNKHMNSRNLLYTAITRAKEKVIIIGEEKELIDSVDRIENVKRNSFIIEKLNKCQSKKKKEEVF